MILTAVVAGIVVVVALAAGAYRRISLRSAESAPDDARWEAEQIASCAARRSA